MTWRQLGIGFGAAGVAFGLALWWTWQPERQVARRFSDLLVAVEARKWQHAGNLISPEYSDEWGSSKGELLRWSEEGLRQFFWITLTPLDPQFTRETDQVMRVETRLRVDGRGTGLALAAMDRVNDLSAPFIFIWRKESGKPWDWKLASVRQSEINRQTTPWE